jgi:hypothetical protein
LERIPSRDGRSQVWVGRIDDAGVLARCEHVDDVLVATELQLAISAEATSSVDVAVEGHRLRAVDASDHCLPSDRASNFEANGESRVAHESKRRKDRRIKEHEVAAATARIAVVPSSDVPVITARPVTRSQRSSMSSSKAR